MNKSRWMTVLRLLLSLGLLALLFVLIDREAFLNTLLSVNPAYYVIGLAIYFSSMFLWAVRWHLFIRASGENVPFWRAVTTLGIGIFYSMFLPTVIGTDVGRMYELGRDESNKKSKVVSGVLLDRLMGLITLCVIAVVALIVGGEYLADDGIAPIIIGALIFVVVGWFVFFNRTIIEVIFRLVFRLPLINRLENGIREVYEALYHLHNRPRLLLLTGGVSLLVTASDTLAALFAAWAIGIDIDPIYFFIFMPIIWLILVIPISISGLGVREGAFVFFFTQVGVSAADAVAISLLVYTFSLIVGMVGGVLLVRLSVSQAARLADSA